MFSYLLATFILHINQHSTIMEFQRIKLISNHVWINYFMLFELQNIEPYYEQHICLSLYHC